MDEEKDYKHDTQNTINNEPNKSDNIGEGRKCIFVNILSILSLNLKNFYNKIVD